MKLLLFYLCVFLEVTTVFVLIFSYFFPKHRIWPPQDKKPWQHYFMAFLFNSISVIIIMLGLIDWGNGNLPNWSLIPGLFVWVMGLVLSIWSISSLGLKSTFGDQEELIKQGPYKFSRNPQYIGFIISLLGWVLMTQSNYTLIVSLLACVPLMSVPFIEEPWLMDTYGEDYVEYKKVVPRFFIRK
jgi:protein-S-isoprenylcysteine O-methyltransferase Ste14